MQNNYPKAMQKTTAYSFRKKMSVMLFVMFAMSLFAFSNSCFAYVTPDWDAQIRANERQNPHSKQVTVNLKKELKNNKRQHVKGKKSDKLSNKKRNARQKSKNKPYKYDRKAELKRNALQRVK